MLRVAGETFEVLPSADALGHSLMEHKAGGVYSPLKSSVLLLDDGGLRVALLTSHFGGILAVPVSNLYRRRVARALGLDTSQVLLFSSHNHCSAQLAPPHHIRWPVDPDAELTDIELTHEGRLLLDGCLQAAARAAERLQPAEIRYGMGRERRITHNRKGRRADGSTYFMREEDRLLLGGDFCGDIDDDAFVVGFFGEREQPICFLTQFTGHPVTAYHCEQPIVHGEFPQVACDDLSAAFGGVPVAFLQGCAGDVNSKGLLSAKPAGENVRDAERFGHYLGDTFRQAAESLSPSSRADLGLAWRQVTLPFKPLPPLRVLERRLREVEAFLARCEVGDDHGTRACDGLNFPTNMTPAYRKTLIEPTRQWLAWAMAFHRERRVHEAPAGLALHIAALRIGDVGLVGLPCEPFQGIGRQIKRDAPLLLAIPCGYMNDTRYNYIPDGPNCGDTEYMSSFYRYRIGLLPYRKPAGDLLARAGVALLRRITPEVR
jgi:hypothetical protein